MDRYGLNQVQQANYGLHSWYCMLAIDSLLADAWLWRMANGPASYDWTGLLMVQDFGL